MTTVTFTSHDVIEIAKRILALHSISQSDIERHLRAATAIQATDIWGDHYAFKIKLSDAAGVLLSEAAPYPWSGGLRDSDGADVLVLVTPVAGRVAEVEFIRGDGNDLRSLPAGLPQHVPRSD